MSAALLARAGAEGAPLVDGRAVTFVWRGRRPPALIGDLNDWDGERPLRLANGELNISGDWATEQRVMTDPRGQFGTLVPLSEAAEFADDPEAAGAIGGARGTEQAAIRAEAARRVREGEFENAEEAEAADFSGLDRQQPGAMGLGSSQQRVTPPSGWKPPPKPDLMTSGRAHRNNKRRP